MSNVNPVHMAKRSRDKLFAGLMRSLNEIENRLQKIEENQNRSIELEQKLLDKINNRGTFTLSESEIMTKIFSGAKLYLNPKDRGFVPHLVLDGEWERNITHAWLSVVKKNDVVVDIGANFGYFAVLAAQQSNRKCKVILFEANPELIPYLKNTIKVNSFEDCAVVENFAITEKEGSVKLNILKDFIASSSIHSVEEINDYMHGKMDVGIATSAKVPATTLDLYCKKNQIQHINLIKMDIEGYEDKAYEGMREIVKKSPDVTMFIEFTKDAYRNPQKFYAQMLKDFGYVYLINEAGSLIKPRNTDYGSVIGTSGNWVMPVFSKNNSLSLTK